MQFFMSRLLLIAFFISVSSFAFCQYKLPDSIKIPESLKKIVTVIKRPISDTTRIRICCGGDSSRKPLFVLNDTLKTLHFEHFILSTNSFDSIEVLNSKKAEAKFGKMAEYGAIIIKTKIGIKLFSLPDLFNHYAIELKDRSLPICVNKYFIKESNKIKSDGVSIESINVSEGDYNFYGSKAIVSGKFINIVTKL